MLSEQISSYILTINILPLKGQSHIKSFQTETGGFRLGPTDVPHPLLTSVHSPFNLLRSFKDDVHRSKTDGIIM